MTRLHKKLTLILLAGMFVGCSALDAPARHKFASRECSLIPTGGSEQHQLRFELISADRSQPASLTRIATMIPGQDSQVFSGEITQLEQEYSAHAKIWLLASLGRDVNGNICLKTRTAVRPVDTQGASIGSHTLMSEQVHRVEVLGACGESFLEARIPGVENTRLQVSTAPQSTADYLHTAETAVSSLCSQVVEFLSEGQGRRRYSPPGA